MKKKTNERLNRKTSSAVIINIEMVYNRVLCDLQIVMRSLAIDSWRTDRSIAAQFMDR